MTDITKVREMADEIERLRYKVKNYDSGLCRVYYKREGEGKSLYCIQESDDGRSYQMFICTKDGEPCWPVKVDWFEVEMPSKQYTIGAIVRAFLSGVTTQIETSA